MDDRTIEEILNNEDELIKETLKLEKKFYTLKAKQMEFINYLEYEIEKYDEFLKGESTDSEYKCLSLKDILYKYNEIMGGKNE